MSRHRTARGREFNMAAFSQANNTVTAVGNSNRNANGDVVDNFGNVITSAKDIQTSYYNKSPTQVKTMGIKEDMTIDTIIQDTKPVAKPNKKNADVDKVKEYQDADGSMLKEVTYLDGSIEVFKNEN